ncbi:MAG: hypothetical protein B7Z08_01615 [Sphingomonadales bacterium 32-68-7]|nr:MAG: hypothetical protein B7Z33_00455 [Sphingomonadales bacterium 12-68-11]OYX10277.1 MAG: hypothetical protein B7Z08_01615 [Sphingomonadales bacterium 32-68-7]
MPRPKGAKSAGYDRRRAELLAAFRERLLARNLAAPSLRELAAAGGVTIPTVRHYFGRREDLIVALLEDLGVQGEAHLAHARDASAPFAESIERLVQSILTGLSMGLSEIHALGLREGLRHDRLGPAYLSHVLEPTVLAIEERLRQHQARGEMRPADTRVAALSLIAPQIVAQIHQRELGGCGTRPLNAQSSTREQIDAFLRAYAAEPGPPRAPEP